MRVLYAFAWQCADFVMRPDILSLARLIIGEAGRIPGIYELLQSVGFDTLRFDDAELAA